MDEQTLSLILQYLQNQDTYLGQMTEDISQIRAMQESLRSDIDSFKLAQEEQQKADVETAEKEAAEKAAFKESLDGVKASSEAMQLSLDNIDKSLASLDVGQYASSFEALQDSSDSVGMTARQTNSFLAVIGFGVFLLLGMLLARTVWRRL